MPSRIYKGHEIADHVDAHLEPYNRVYRQYSVNFGGNDYRHNGRDMSTLWTGWYFTLAAAKQAIRDHWEKLQR